MRIFASDQFKNIMQRVGLEEGESIEHRMLSGAIERAQKRVEGRNFDIRKRILEFDDVLNEQRKVIYEQRREILHEDDIFELVRTMRADVLSNQFQKFIPEYEIESNWKIKDFEEVLENEYDLKIDVKKILDKKELDLEKSNEEIIIALQKKYDEKSDLHKDIFSEVEKQIVLQVIDQSWKNHINALEQLRQNIGFRSYAGKDPRLEYKRESFEMFQELLENIKFESIRYLSKITISSDENSLSQPESKKIITQRPDAPSLFDKKELESQKVIEKPRISEGNRKLRRMQAKANRKKRK